MYVLIFIFGALLFLAVFNRLRRLENDIKLIKDVILGKEKKEKLEEKPSYAVPRPAPETRAVPAIKPEIEQVKPAEAEKPIPVKIKKPVGPSFIDQLVKKLPREEMEMIIGGNWLNKAGALIFIIGLTLFLGYSFRYLGPLGRVIVGFLISGSLLAGGVFLDQKSMYRTFARGIIGAGWAGIYFTTYAMYAFEPSKIVYDPLTATTLLFIVSLLMVAHSLLYRSELVTGMAYTIGFITLAITPLTPFSPIALLLLVFSLLSITYKFSWDTIGICGLLATYGIYALKAGGGQFYEELPYLEFLKQHSILVIYWILFEVFSLMNVKKLTSSFKKANAFMPLNACGFIGVSLLQVGTSNTANFLITAGVLYLASSLARAILKPAAPLSEVAEVYNRMVAGGYEGPITIATFMITPFLFHKFSGLRLNLALLLEAEFLFLLGIYLNQLYLRVLSMLIFVIPLLKFVFYEFTYETSEFNLFAGLKILKSSMVALLMAAVFYVNRFLTLAKKGIARLELEKAFTYSAALILLLVMKSELPLRYFGLGQFILAMLLFAIGLRSALIEFRLQSYFVLVFGLISIISVNVYRLGVTTIACWVSLIAVTLLTYLNYVRFLSSPPKNLLANELQAHQYAAPSIGTAFMALLCWYFFPVPLTAIAWGIMALLLLEIGFYYKLPILRLLGSIMSALCFVRLFMANFTSVGITFGVSHRLITVIPVIIFFYYLSLKYKAESKALPDREKILERIYLYLPAVLLFCLIRFEFGRVTAVIGWAFLMLVFLIIGKRKNIPDLRFQSYALAALTFLRSWATNFYIPESLAGMFGRVVTGSIVIACLYLAQFIAKKPKPIGEPKRWVDLVENNSRTILSLLATVLLTVLLFYEVSGSLLTVAWGIEGVLLLVAGFPFREKVLRLSGLALFFICILKLFIYDLSGLDIVYRIISFVVLGALLLIVSFIYTKFRKQIRTYLVEE